MNRDQLVKVLALMGSDSDHDALSAARQVERMRTAAGTSWDELVSPWPGDEALSRRLLAVDRNLGRLHKHDQRAFVELRERFFEAGDLGVSDMRRLDHFHAMAVPAVGPYDDDIPF